MKLKILFAALSLIISLAAQPIAPRYNFNSLLEPQSKIINGAGQSPDAFYNYWNVMNENEKPAIFMTYVNLKDVESDWSVQLKNNLLSYGNNFIIPQIGLSMTEDGNPSAHYEDDVAAGLYDEQIENFISGLRTLAFPAYVRIGYEFNGTTWNGYEAESYKAAFARITNMIRASGLEAATVWCFAMDGVMNFMDFYPGDSSVDWWAIDIFSAEHFSNINSDKFLDSAYTHQKPVMIGETTPRYVGVLQGQVSWDSWFAPFFNFIHTKPSVKAFCYINWDWSLYPQWNNWGDARLEANSIVAGHFTSEMDSNQYLHSMTESDFRETFGIPDNTAPDVPQNFNANSSLFPPELSWNSVTDPSGLSHYKIFRNNQLYDYTLDIPYYDFNVAAGQSFHYKISVMDRAGNESQQSSELNVQIPSVINKALNGDFNNGKSFWKIFIYNQNAAADFEIDSSFTINGKYSAKVIVNQSSGTNWHIQLAQSFKIYNQRKYIIKFSAKASANKSIQYWIQQSESPYQILKSGNVNLNTTTQTIIDSFTVTQDDNVRLNFILGNSQLATVWIDDISLTEIFTGTTDINGETEIGLDEFNLSQNYPNPFNPSTKISWLSPVGGWQTLKVYDVLGNEVANLIDEFKSAGSYEVSFDATHLSSGVYFYKLQAGSFSATKKLILMK